jgi:hypothetical protein
MVRIPFCAALAIVALAGCSHDVPEARTARHAHRAEIRDCVANIEVYSPAASPREPYRVLAPVDAGFVGNWGWTSTSRFNRMKKRACELGADAIIDADDPRLPSRVTTTYQYDEAGRPVSVVQEAPRSARGSTALAIQFVGPGAAPQQVTVAPQGPQQVVVVAQPPQEVLLVPQQAPQVVVVQ